MTFDELTNMLGKNKTFPSVQEITPVDAQLGYTLTFTPQLSSGLPVQEILLSTALVASVMNAEPMVKENFSYGFGMQNAFVPMPKIGRNMYNLTGKFFNAVASYAGVYAFINLMTNANSLILCKMELSNNEVTSAKKLVMRNSCIYDRPNFLGIAAGATEESEIETAFSIVGSIDFTNTQIGDGLLNIVNSLGSALGVIDGLTKG